MCTKASSQELLSDRTITSLEEEIRELEDTYAECLKDEVERSTLNCLWGRIKVLRQEIVNRKN